MFLQPVHIHSPIDSLPPSNSPVLPGEAERKDEDMEEMEKKMWLVMVSVWEALEKTVEPMERAEKEMRAAEESLYEVAVWGREKRSERYKAGEYARRVAQAEEKYAEALELIMEALEIL